MRLRRIHHKTVRIIKIGLKDVFENATIHQAIIPAKAANMFYLAEGDAVFRLSSGKPEKNPVDPVNPV
jgi:hypothetical protein